MKQSASSSTSAQIRRLFSSIGAAAFMLLAMVAASYPVGGAPLVWKPVTNAFLRVDDQGAKQWGVFQIEKKTDRYLLQLADRFLLVDAPQKQVYELLPEKIERAGSDLRWDPADRPESPLITSNWLVRDVGLAFRIKMRLDSEDRTLDLQIPHPSTR